MMRIVELLIVITLFLALAARVWPATKRPSWTDYLPGAALLLILAHLLGEQYRWPMVPSYALAIGLFGLSLPGLMGRNTGAPGSRARRIARPIGLALGFLALALAAALPNWFPQFELPDPSGPYAVGTTSFAFDDESRPETFTADPADHRLIYVQAWYPAESAAATRAPMWIAPETVTDQLAQEFLLPRFALSHLATVQSHSYFDAPLAKQASRYPSLVFSHGYDAGFFAQNTVQMEELASHGYVVFSIGHAYESSLVFDAQGQAILMSDTQKEAFYREDLEARDAYLKVFTAAGAEQAEAVRDWLAATPIAQQSTQIWAQDTQYVFGQIEAMNSGLVDSPFAGRLDTARMGVFGQSFGGSVALYVCAIDSRCRAAVNMDGTQWGDLLTNPLRTPFMMMSGENTKGINDWALNDAPARGYGVYVRDAFHINFTDLNLVSPLFKFPLFGALGKIDGDQMEQIMNAYTLAFFDQTLKGLPSPLLEGPSRQFPEVELTAIGASSYAVAN